MGFVSGDELPAGAGGDARARTPDDHRGDGVFRIRTDVGCFVCR